MNMKPTQQQFDGDVAGHVTTVVHEDGLYRHIVSRDPATSIYWFEVITSPGLLTVNGDCGTFVFALPGELDQDVTRLFRTENLNPHYWSQKIRAGEVWEYSPELAEQFIVEEVDGWGEQIPDELGGNAVFTRLRDQVADEVLPFVDDEHLLREALTSFRSDQFSFDSSEEWDLYAFAYKYIWCLRAIRHAINAYDRAGR